MLIELVDNGNGKLMPVGFRPDDGKVHPGINPSLIDRDSLHPVHKFLLDLSTHGMFAT